MPLIVRAFKFSLQYEKQGCYSSSQSYSAWQQEFYLMFSLLWSLPTGGSSSSIIVSNSGQRVILNGPPARRVRRFQIEHVRLRQACFTIVTLSFVLLLWLLSGNDVIQISFVAFRSFSLNMEPHLRVHFNTGRKNMSSVSGSDWWI